MPSKRKLELLKKFSDGPMGILRFGKVLLGFSEIVYDYPHLEIAEELWKIWKSEKPETTIMAHRGLFKTTLCSIIFPAWVLCQDRTKTIFLVSSTSALAGDCVRSVRDLLTKEEVVGVYGPFKEYGRNWQKTEFEVKGLSLKSKEPSMRAGGVDTQLTGGHYDFIICDDLESRENTYLATEDKRRKVKEYYDALKPILRKTKNEVGKRILVGTPWHFDGLMASLDADVKIPAIVDGKIAFPQVITEEFLESVKKADPLLYKTQYMLDVESTRPTTLGRSSIKLIKEEEVDKANSILYIKVDLGGNTDTSDPYAIVFLAAQRLANGHKRYVVWDYKKYNVDVLVFANTLIDFYQSNKGDWREVRIVVEMVGWQTRFNEIWRSACESRGIARPPIKRIDDRFSKERRFQSIVQYLITGSLVFVEKSENQELIDEVVNFGSTGFRDDGVDALSFDFEKTVFPVYEAGDAKEIPMEKFVESMFASKSKDSVLSFLA